MNRDVSLMGLRALLCLLVGLCAVSGCAPTPDSSPTPTSQTSPWGVVHTLASAEYRSAPAAVTNGAITMFAWAGADMHESRLYAASMDAASPTILSLKVSSPLDVQIFAAAEERFHVLWRDDVAGEPHLFYSLFNAQAVAELDAHDLSEQPVYNAAVLPQANGSMRLIYSAGWMAEPSLFLQDIDAKGRSQFPADLSQIGDFPALLAYDTTLWVFWQTEDGGLWQSPLEENALSDPHRILSVPSLEPGDAVVRLTASGDATYRYLFWQLMRADGRAETWFAVGEKTGTVWSPAMPLTIPTVGTDITPTGYQVGDVLAVERGAEIAGWSAPLSGVQPIVPIAVQTGDVLGVAYLQAGNVIGYQRLLSIDAMIGAPLLTLRPDRSLVLAWSEPKRDAAALKWLVSKEAQ